MGLRDVRKFHWNVTIRNSIGLMWGTRHPALRSAMTRAEEYRLRAKEAEEQANKVRDPSAKQGFLDIARQWREMAEQADRHGW